MKINITKLLNILTIVLLITVFCSAQRISKEGPFEKLIIANAMIIPGHGGPAYGPADIIIEKNRIVQIISYNGKTGRGEEDTIPTGDKIIDATGMYVMPGLIDLHTHIRTPELPLDYIYNMKLAHGVTTMVNGSGRGWKAALEQQRLSNANLINAPRMFPIRDWGPSRSRDPGHEPPYNKIKKWNNTDPVQVLKLAKKLIKDGAHVIRIGSLAWNAELFGTVAKAIYEAGGITTVHLPPSDISVVNAVDAAELGVTMIEHHYGYAESALGGSLQPFPSNYNYMNEADRFRYAGLIWQEAPENILFGEVVDRLVKSGVSMIPTMSAYEANRDLNRAMGLPWHQSFTHAKLIDWYFPNPEYHGAYHWNWTSKDEQIWSNTFRKWQRLIYEFNKRGGHLSYAVDDPYIWNTSGIANVRELQLMEEAGLHPLEIIRSATYNSAKTLRQPELGLIKTGFIADLAIVDGNPLENFHYLYAFGGLKFKNNKVERHGGVKWTIKGGVIFDNQELIKDVLKTVKDSKENWIDPIPPLFKPSIKFDK
tara:strand:- start:910 stop:2520 length:1611 start_codon:yes stop_codon:yes gene_type:complete